MDFKANNNNLPWSFGDYGPVMRANKANLVQAMDSNGLDEDTKCLFLSMAFIETNDMTSAQRDASKDQMGDSANISLFNLNPHMIKAMGYQGNPWDLNSDSQLPTLIGVMKQGLQKFGVEGYCNYVRGGSVGYQDHTSYDCIGYRNTIATIYNVVKSNLPSIMTDSRRVQVVL